MEINLTIPEWFVWAFAIFVGILIVLKVWNLYLTTELRHWTKKRLR